MQDTIEKPFGFRSFKTTFYDLIKSYLFSTFKSIDLNPNTLKVTPWMTQSLVRSSMKSIHSEVEESANRYISKSSKKYTHR